PSDGGVRLLFRRLPAGNARAGSEAADCPVTAPTLCGIRRWLPGCAPGWRRRSPDDSARAACWDRRATQSEIARPPAECDWYFDTPVRVAREPERAKIAA